MQFNRLIRTGDLDWLKTEGSFFAVAADDSINADCIWKWGTIYRAVEELKLLHQGSTFVDIGGGQAPLQYIFSNRVNVLNVDTEKQKYLPPMKGWIPRFLENVHHIKKDFLEWITKAEDKSIDLFYDSCSLIHFGWDGGKERPLVIDEVMPHIVRTLKPGGYFISASDLCHPASAPYGDMLYSSELAKLYNINGLEFVDKPDWNLESFYKNVENGHQPQGKTKVWQHRTTKDCSDGCRDLPEHHLLMAKGAGKQRGGIYLIMGLFVLRKPNG